VPIVFVSVPDPVGAGFVDTSARPGGNTTGFTNFEYGMGAKWLELLREIAPAVRQVVVVRDPSTPAGNIADAERGIAAFARRPNGGLS
jgi:putative tryptophan/tyrosine transport system substrate-binding protein